MITTADEAPFVRGSKAIKLFEVSNPNGWAGPPEGVWIVPEANPTHPGNAEWKRAREAAYAAFLTSISGA